MGLSLFVSLTGLVLTCFLGLARAVIVDEGPVVVRAVVKVLGSVRRLVLMVLKRSLKDLLPVLMVGS